MMKSLNLLASLLALFPLSSAFCYTAEADIKVHSKWSFGSAPISHDLELQRARVILKEKVAPYWDAEMRFDIAEADNNQIGLSYKILSQSTSSATLPWAQNERVSFQPVISQAFVLFSQIDGIVARSGLIAAPEVSSQQLYYQPFEHHNQSALPIGSPQEKTGNHLGTAYHGDLGHFGYDIGVWLQTRFRKVDILQIKTVRADDLQSFSDIKSQQYVPTDFDTRRLRLGIGGRLHYSYQYQPDVFVGLGLGYSQSPLNVPIVIHVVGSYQNSVAESDKPSGLTTAWYASTSFKDLTKFAIDGCFTLENIQWNIGYQFQQTSADLFKSNEPDPAPRLTLFNQDGLQEAWHFEAAYLWGSKYAFNTKQAVISGIKKSDKPCLEVVGRLGYEYTTNALALLTPTGWEDWQDGGAHQLSLVQQDDPDERLLMLSIDNTNAVQPLTAGNSERALQERARGFGLGLNYYFSSQIVSRLSYEYTLYDYKKQNNQDWEASRLYACVKKVRLSVEYHFS